MMGNPERKVQVAVVCRGSSCSYGFVNGVYDDDRPGRLNGTGAQHERGTGVIILYHQTK